MTYEVSGTGTFVEGDDLHFVNNAAMQQMWDDIRRTIIVGDGPRPPDAPEASRKRGHP
jgi:methyl coenzyme M reductase alpha subunit